MLLIFEQLLSSTSKSQNTMCRERNLQRAQGSHFGVHRPFVRCANLSVWALQAPWTHSWQLVNLGSEKGSVSQHASQQAHPLPILIIEEIHSAELIHCYPGLLPHPQTLARVPWLYPAYTAGELLKLQAFHEIIDTLPRTKASEEILTSVSSD